jgi:hypothetical protein
MPASLKIRQLESKIIELKSLQDELVKKRNLVIAQQLSNLNLAHQNHKKLMGALLFINDKLSANDLITEDWFKAGDNFLRRKKTKSRSVAKISSQTQPVYQP